MCSHSTATCGYREGGLHLARYHVTMERQPLPSYLRGARRRLGLTQRSVAFFLGSTSSSVARHESHTRVPSLRRAIGYSLILGVSVPDLFAGVVAEESRRLRGVLRETPEQHLVRLHPRRRPGPRVVALQHTPRGFAYACLEGSRRLVEYGRVETGRRGDRHQRARRLVTRFRPDLVVLEERWRETWPAFTLSTRWVTRADVQSAFRRVGGTKEVIADELVLRFPELVRVRPPRRRTWMSEDRRMHVFDAVAFALTALGEHRVRRERSHGCRRAS